MRGLISRLTHLGVDPRLPRNETKHIVLTNSLTLIYTALFGIVPLGPDFHTLLPIVHTIIFIGIAWMPTSLLLNARGWDTLAGVNNVFGTQLLFFVIGLFEPDESHHELFVMMAAIVSWFVFPPKRRVLSFVATATGFAGALTLMIALHRSPPAQLASYNPYEIGFGNRFFFFVLVIFAAAYAAREVTRAERELIAEREKTERVLKDEVSHQVAERSRELGEAIGKIDGVTTPRALAIGDRFHGRYRVVKVLGEGGMGVVYEVERLTDTSRYALKVVSGAMAGANAARFAREAEIGARVRHANLVSIVDVGVDAGTPFLVMELVPGSSLEDARARFGDEKWARPILVQIIAGLVALHDAGVVHRDLKPANVLLSDAGAKISDFGISRFGRATPIDVDAATLAARKDLTGTGAFLGTPLYMPPEAARGGRVVDAPGDVFAFGIIAYELLSGRAPFAMPPVLVAMAGQALPEPAPFDSDLAPIVIACLSSDPSRRPSAHALRDAFGG
jgi:hypothetical protein